MKSASAAAFARYPSIVSQDIGEADAASRTPFIAANVPTTPAVRRSKRQAAAQAAALDWARKKQRSGVPAPVFQQDLAASAEPAAPTASPSAQSRRELDCFSRLPDGPLNAILNNFPAGGVEPARLAAANPRLYPVLQDRIHSDRLIAALQSGDAAAIIGIIGQAQTLPFPLQATVLASVAARISKVATPFTCIAAQLDALRLAIGALPPLPYRNAALNSLAEQFYDFRFKRVPVTPALDVFFKACRTDFEALGSVPLTQDLMTRWAAGLRMMRDPLERLSTWQALFASNQAYPKRENLLISLGFVLEELEPPAARLAAIDTLIDEIPTVSALFQAFMMAPILQALGTSAASHEQRDSRFDRLSRIAGALPQMERQQAMQYLVSRLDLADWTKRFDIMRSTLAQIPANGLAYGPGLLYASIKAIPYLFDGPQRATTWHACACLLHDVSPDDRVAVLNALIDVIVCMPGAECQWQRFSDAMCHVLQFDQDKQALAVPHLLAVIGKRQLAQHTAAAMAKVMLIVQMLPAPQRGTHLCKVLEVLHPSDAAAELMATMQWVRANTARLPRTERAAVAIAMSNALFAFANHNLLYMASQIVEHEAAQLDGDDRVGVLARIDQCLLTEADTLNGELLLMHPEQFLPRFGALVSAVCNRSDRQTAPVIDAVLDLVRAARDNHYNGAASMLRRCRDDFPAALQHLVDAVAAPDA